MTETVELRNNPKLRIILSEDGIEIVDISEPKNSGIYAFDRIEKVELNAERTNWFVSILSWIMDLFIGSSNGGNYKSKANLKLKMVHRTLKISLTDSDFEKAVRIAKLINTKKTYAQHL